MRPLKLTLTAFGSYAEKTIIPFDAFENGIFLITGDTGAGKTTIFDGIVYALYGTLSGSSKGDRESSMMHSDLVDKSIDTEVELEFEHNGKNYRVERTLHFKKARGTSDQYSGLEQKAILVLPDGTVLKNPGVVTDRISELLGLNDLQFRQIVMLAQGEFKKFLQADSKGKSDILGTLFDNSLYIRYEKILQESYKTIADQRADDLDSIQKYMTEMFKQPESDAYTPDMFAPDNPDLSMNLHNLINDETRESEDLKKKKETINNQKSELERRINDAEKINEKFESLAQEEEHEKQLKAQETTMHAQKERMERVRLVLERIHPLVQKNQEDTSRLRDLQQDIETKKTDLKNAEAACAKAEADSKNDDALKQRIEEYTGQIRTLTDSLPNYEKQEQLIKSQNTKNKQLNELNNELEMRNKRIENSNARILELESKLSEETQIATQLKDANQQEKELKEKQEQLLDPKGFKGHIHQRNDLNEELKKILSSMPKAQQEEQDAHAEFHALYDRFIRAQAGQLGLDLCRELEEHDHAECPVCHSALTHADRARITAPSKETPRQQDVDKAQKKLDLAKTRILQLESDRREHTSKIQLLEEQILQEGARLFEERPTLSQLLDRDVMNAFHKDLKSKLEQCKELIKKLNEKTQRLKEARKEYNALKQQQPEEEKKIKSLQDESQKLQSELSALLGQCKELSDSLTFKNRNEAEQHLKTLKTKKNESEETVRMHVLACNNAQQRLFSVQGALKTDENNLPAYLEQVEKSTKILEDQVHAQGFGSLQEAEAILPEKDTEQWIKRMEEQLKNYEDEVLRTTERLLQLRKETKDKHVQDLDALHHEASVLHQNIESLQTCYDQSNVVLSKHKDVQKNVDLRIQNLKDTDEAARMLKDLSDLAIGTNGDGGKLSFSRYVMGAIFKEIVEAANIALQEMSGGQYELVHCIEANRKNAQAGLELEVMDYRSEHQRPSASLSGGESFIVSLALALGLSSVVRSRCNGSSLETLFIDEGFGTLDDDVLDKALSALNRLKEDGHALIGLISHVSRLEECIPQQLIVRNSKSDRKGSTITVRTA